MKNWNSGFYAGFRWTQTCFLICAEFEVKKTSASSFYKEINFKQCLTKQLLNMFKLWCERGISLAWLELHRGVVNRYEKLSVSLPCRCHVGNCFVIQYRMNSQWYLNIEWSVQLANFKWSLYFTLNCTHLIVICNFICLHQYVS